ncbi:MAG: DUF1127 domain-containing protein [Hyphomicrobiaceae bacterium]
MSQTAHYGTGQTCTCRRHVDWSSPREVLIWSIRRVTLKVRGWMERSRQRQALSDLDEHQLKDIGLSRAAAMAEARKSFWM